MKRFVSPPFALLVGLVTSPALALQPPGAAERGLRDGANHHTGDDGFIALEGHAPTAHDAESVRMHDHFVTVRARLAALPAPTPALESRRAELLGYLDEYIAKGTTPANDHVPWRAPVFIDDDGTICAVGYLIERSAGRPAAEEIARAHRYDYIEDIAAKEEAVRAWVASSGFTIAELGLIQPGYIAAIDTWHRWDPKSPSGKPNDDGAYVTTDHGVRVDGELRNDKMQGAWSAHRGEALVGKGAMKNGTGDWESFYENGTKLAHGRYVHNVPAGNWRFFHESGRLAAEGAFERGQRTGRWRFYYDDKVQTPITEGSFSTGAWLHYDEHGALLARSSNANPAAWGGPKADVGHLIEFYPGHDGIHHWHHAGNLSGDGYALDLSVKGSTKVYKSNDVLFNDALEKLDKTDYGWTASACAGRTPLMLRAARAGDVVTLDSLLTRDEPSCSNPKPVGATTAANLDGIVAAQTAVRARTPAFVAGMQRELGYGDAEPDATATSDDAPRDDAPPADLTAILRANTGWYVEFSHVDGRFIRVFKTLPGYSRA